MLVLVIQKLYSQLNLDYILLAMYSSLSHYGGIPLTLAFPSYRHEVPACDWDTPGQEAAVDPSHTTGQDDSEDWWHSLTWSGRWLHVETIECPNNRSLVLLNFIILLLAYLLNANLDDNFWSMYMIMNSWNACECKCLVIDSDCWFHKFCGSDVAATCCFCFFATIFSWV